MVYNISFLSAAKSMSRLFFDETGRWAVTSKR